MFHSRFHDEYTGVIYLEQLDKYNNVNYRCIMVDAFPVQLAQMSFGYASSDIAKFNVHSLDIDTGIVNLQIQNHLIY